MAVNRNLPYGHYELSATTADGWFLSGHGSKLNVEFEKGLSLKLVAPTPAPFGRLTIRDDANLRLAGSAGLRFGTLEELVNNGPAFSISPVPEPDGDLGEYSSFPTVTNGIEQVGIEIRFEMTKNISQPSPSGTHLNSKWKWTPVDNAKSSCRYLIVDGQARAFVNQSVYHDIPFHGLPMEECEMFKLPSAKHRVGGSLFALHEPTAMPLEIEIPAGEMSIYVERIIGKPSLTTMKALNWEPHKDQPELWLEADVQRDSAWIERLIDTSDWIRTNLKPGFNEISGHLQMHKLIRAGETLEVSLAPKPIDQKTSNASAARTLDDITAKPQTDQVIDALVTIEFVGLVGNAKLSTSGIGWVVDQHGHIIVPSEIAPSSENYSIEVRYADGSRTSAKRVFTFGHLALLKPEKAPAIVPIRLSSQRLVQDGDQVLAILNGTDVQKGTVTSAKKTIVSSDSWPVRYSPPLRFPNAIETDFKSDAATLFGAPLLTPSGEVVGMLLNYAPPLFAIPLSEIQIACREFESSQRKVVRVSQSELDNNASDPPAMPSGTLNKEVDLQPEFPLIAWDFEYPLLGRRMAKLRVSKDFDLESVFPGRQTVKGKAPEAEVKELIELIAQSASDDDGLRYQNTVSRIAEFEQVDTSVRTERVAVNRAGRILELQLNKSLQLDIENRLWRLEGIVAIGGQDALTDLMAIANRQLQTQFPEITYKLTTRDFLFGIMQDSGTRIVYIRIPVKKSVSTNRVEMNFTLTVPSIGEPKLEHIFDANSADDPPIETPLLPKTLDKSTREMDSSKIYTVEELIANGMDLLKKQEPVTVRFKVASVRRNGVIDPDGKETQHWFLSSEEYKGGPDPKAFQVQVSMDAEKDLERSGVKDIPAHFNGQDLITVGKVSTSGLELPGRDTIWFYSITLERLTQLHFVNADGNSSLPQKAIDETAAGLVEKIATESKAPTLDLRNARSVIEAYVASALVGDVAKAASLAKNSPADPRRIRELPEFLNIQRLKIETVYINDPRNRPKPWQLRWRSSSTKSTSNPTASEMASWCSRLSCLTTNGL